MIMDLVNLVVFWQNPLHPPPSITGDLSSWKIITGMMVDYVKNSDYSLGSMPKYTKHTATWCRPMWQAPLQSFLQATQKGNNTLWVLAPSDASISKTVHLFLFCSKYLTGCTGWYSTTHVVSTCGTATAVPSVMSPMMMIMTTLTTSNTTKRPPPSTMLRQEPQEWPQLTYANCGGTQECIPTTPRKMKKTDEAQQVRKKKASHLAKMKTTIIMNPKNRMTPKWPQKQNQIRGWTARRRTRGWEPRRVRERECRSASPKQ